MQNFQRRMALLVVTLVGGLTMALLIMQPDLSSQTAAHHSERDGSAVDWDWFYRHTTKRDMHFTGTR